MIPCITADEMKDLESDSDWQFVTVGDQVCLCLCKIFNICRCRQSSVDTETKYHLQTECIVKE